MNKIRSIYLEILRLSAALYVFIFHMSSEILGGKYYLASDSFKSMLGLKFLSAHYFVIVFFVISGFLITMSVKKPNVTFKFFFISRLGRLYSVLLPALIFSYIVAMILIKLDFLAPNDFKSFDHLTIRFILNILFLTQSWSLSYTPPLNTPFWSVTYEFMYYAIIGAFVLIDNKLLKICVTLIVLILAGPRILILFPTWLVGSLLYFYRNNHPFKSTIYYLLFFITSVLITTIIVTPQIMPFTTNEGNGVLFGQYLHNSWNFKADFVFSLLVGLNIYSLFGVSNSLTKKVPELIFGQFYDKIRTVGNCTYTLYLFHMPLLFLFALVLPYQRSNVFHEIGMIGLILLVVYLIARQTEWKIEFWRTLVAGFFERSCSVIRSVKKSNIY